MINHAHQMPDQAARLRLDIVVNDEAWPERITNAAFLRSVALAIENHLDFDAGETAVVAFSNDAEVRTLNTRFRNVDKPTNVLSFPAITMPPASQPRDGDGDGDAPSTNLGDIILAHETVEREAKAQGIEFDHHVAHLMVHGVLHLLGYDHENDDAAAEDMELLEIEILAELGIANPYIEEHMSAD